MAIFAVTENKNHAKVHRKSQGTPKGQNTLEKDDGGHHCETSRHITK